MRGPNGEELPGAVLFACTMNSVRSPLAAALMRSRYGKFVFVDSVGVKAGEADPLVGEVLDEIGLELGKHKPKAFENLEDESFDLVITLSPEAHHKALELTRVSAVEVEYWPTIDPTVFEGSRAQRLEAYRQVRDQLEDRIAARFAVRRAGDI
ncbi:MAG: low molecular weight phosphatase family protein [Alphaproteobacteria bacterium]|nr:low molecular weight phosphatase family protein [Alphaproteobacteria bacterium]